MQVFAIGDLHLSSSGEKPMDIFGPHWKDHGEKIAHSWRSSVQPEDLVLVPGDISWAMRLEEAREDLDWLDTLPGMKILIKGNHDYWWPGIGKLRALLKGSSIRVLQYDSVRIGSVVVGGTRMWTIPGMVIPGSDMLEPKHPSSKPCEPAPRADEREAEAQDRRIFLRELGRLRLSLESMDKGGEVKIVMTHFPPTSENGPDTPVTSLLEDYGVQICVFGHLHDLGLPPGTTIDFVKNGVRYVLVSADAVGFAPYKLF
jgi:predicted phosphohydrolase